jgi:hypothetical protein
MDEANRISVLSACVGIVVLGCGGASGESRGTCGRIEPCGGDLVGSWKPAGSCFDPPTFLRQIASVVGIECPSGEMLSVQSSTLNRSISATFAADGTYSGLSQTTGMLAFDVPRACLASGTCGDLDSAFAPLVQPGVVFDTAACTGDTMCTCTVTENLGDPEGGTYTIAGSMLETTSYTAGTVTQTPYCVSGNLLHLVNVDPASAGPAAMITSDAMAERE